MKEPLDSSLGIPLYASSVRELREWSRQSGKTIEQLVIGMLKKHRKAKAKANAERENHKATAEAP